MGKLLRQVDGLNPSTEGTEYTTCQGLLWESSSEWPESALFQIANNGVDRNKLVIGKPATQSDATGFMHDWDLHTCVAEAHSKGWGEYSNISLYEIQKRTKCKFYRWRCNGLGGVLCTVVYKQLGLTCLLDSILTQVLTGSLKSAGTPGQFQVNQFL